jgi:hypothetical protein
MTNLSDFEIVPFPDIEDGNVIFEDVHDMSDWVVVQSSQDQKSNDAVESIRKRIHTTSEVFPKNYIGGVYCSPNCTSRFYDQYVTHHTKIQPMTSEWQDQIVSFEKHIRVSEKKSINSLILSGKRAGKRDDMCLTLMRAIRNMYLFKTLDCYRELRCCTGR